MFKNISKVRGILKQFSDKKKITMTTSSSTSTQNASCGTPDYGYKNEKLIYPSAHRNKEPILQVLKRFITVDQDCRDVLFLEISSGSGQHIAHFAPNFPHITFQPSEYDKNNLSSIRIYVTECSTRNIKEPIYIDITKDLRKFELMPETIDYIYNANMMHIAPFDCTEGLFTNAGVFLKPDGLLITYGPYGKDGVITPQSNVDFNASLKSRNPDYGIRDIADLMKLGALNQMSLIDTIDMPANNNILIWKKNLNS